MDPGQLVPDLGARLVRGRVRRYLYRVTLTYGMSGGNPVGAFGGAVPRLVQRYLGHLRFPTLFLLTALLFLVNVVVADPLPFVDEILLALVGLLLGSLRDGKENASTE